jgi:hypothetical protein
MQAVGFSDKKTNIKFQIPKFRKPLLEFGIFPFGILNKIL